MSLPNVSHPIKQDIFLENEVGIDYINETRSSMFILVMSNRDTQSEPNHIPRVNVKSQKCYYK